MVQVPIALVELKVLCCFLSAFEGFQVFDVFDALWFGGHVCGGSNEEYCLLIRENCYIIDEPPLQQKDDVVDEA